MAMALASALPAALDTLAEVLKLSARKDDQGARLMRQMSRPRKLRAGEDPAGIYWHDDPEKLERLHSYCRQDVEVERELFHRLPPLTDSEQTLWALDATINQRGFHTDGALLEAASRIAAAAGQAVQEELARITAGALTSTDQVAALLSWLGEHGCEVKDLRKPTLKHALRRKELDPVTRRVIELGLAPRMPRRRRSMRCSPGAALTAACAARCGITAPEPADGLGTGLNRRISSAMARTSRRSGSQSRAAIWRMLRSSTRSRSKSLAILPAR